MAESSFARNGSKSFINISQDNRIHLWDTDTRKERRSYVEKNHLAHTYTCSSWKGGKKDNLGYFAAGASDGTVVVWDLARGVVAKVIGEANEGPAPTAVVFSNDAKTILVASSQPHVTQYNLVSGEVVETFKVGKKGILRIAMNPKVDVFAVGGTTVRVIDMATGRKRKLEAAFSGGISSIAFTQCGRYLVVSGSGSREVLIFDVQADSQDTPKSAIAVKGEPKTVIARSNGSFVDILCVFQDADAAFIRYNITNDSEVAVAVAAVSHIKTASEVLAGCFGNPGSAESKNSSDITLAVGQKSNPLYANLVVVAEDGSVVKNIEVAGSTKAKENSSSSSQSSSQSQLVAPPTILGPNETGGSKRPLVGDDDDADVADGGDQKKSKKAKPSEGVEMTLEQRLESLSAELSEIEKSTTAAAAADPNAIASAAVLGEAPTAASLVTLMDQALQSGDDALLEQCLGCEDLTVVEGTARRLAPARVVQLLKKLMAKFEKRPSRGVLLTRWLVAVLRSHTAFLMSIPDLSAQLAGLSQMLENRLATYSKLAALGGRLDLLMSQVSSRAGGDNVAQEDAKKEPRKVYRED